MQRKDLNWHGNFNAVVTPMNADGSIDFEAFAANLRLLLDEGIHGLVVAGSTGEGWALSAAERRDLVVAARKTVAGRVPVWAGTSATRTTEVVRLSRDAAAAGADAALIMPPAVALPGADEIVDHYRAVAEAIDIPIVVYNYPQRQGYAMSNPLLTRLAEIDAVAAVKQSTPDFTELLSTVVELGDKILVFAGLPASRGLPAVIMGCDGFVSSLAPQVLGRAGIELYDLARAGNLEQARRTQYRCLALSRLLNAHGTFPASLKAAMNLAGRPGGLPRDPLRQPTVEETAALEAGLRRLDVL